MLIGNRYELHEQIGAGGMGTVFRGLDTQSGEPVAIKRLKEDAIAQDPGIVQRFQREAEALRQLNHPNIVKVLASPDHDDQHFIVMEYMAAGSLRDAVHSGAPLAISRVVSIALDLADALTRAHRLNIIHRDLKPANVLLADDGTPRLTDFGVARIGSLERVTGTGVAIGTLDYLPPEAINGHSVDARADIWSFGVMLFEMLAGKHPFDNESLGQTITAILTQPAPDLEALRPDTPIALVDLVYRMLEKDRDARISSVRLVGVELEAIMQGLESGTLSSTARRELVRPVRDITFSTPTPATDQIKHNLPAQTTPFVGREGELAELAKLLNDPNRRLVTILAPGGMGKTRLALETAGRFAETSLETRKISTTPLTRFKNGVYFIALAPLSAPENIVPAIAEAVGFQFYPGGEPKQQLLDYFREKALMLVADNFEHIIGGAGIIAEILQAASGIKVLATSRERLNLSGETVFNLGGMDFPDWKTPEEAFEYSAIKLFLQGAGRSQPGFELRADDLPHAARICRMVQGMPLGILLAAAWVEMLPLPEIADEISRSLDFLESEMRDVPERHRSIRAVFEYSWNLLSDEERAVFAKMSVFRGGFTREAAQAVAAAGLRPLTALVNKSLLRRNPDTGRYEVHELLRQYAETRLKQQPEIEKQVHDLHAVFYTDFLAAHEAPLWSRDEKKAVEAIEFEIENIRTALNWALESGTLEPIDRSLNALELFYDMRSMGKEGSEVFGHLLKSLEQRGLGDDNPFIWRVRALLGALLIFLGDYDECRRLAEGSLGFFRQSGQKQEQMIPLNVLNYVSMMQGQYAEARQRAEDHLLIAREFKDHLNIAKSQASLGYVLFLQGNLDEAKRIYREVLSEQEAYTPIYGMSVMLNNLGEILHTSREEEEAARLFEKSYLLAKEAGIRRNMAIALNNLGNVAHNLGDYKEAQRRFEESLKLSRDIGDRRGVADGLNRLGNLGFSGGNYPTAKRYLGEAQAAYRQIGDRRGTANSLTLLGFVSAISGDPDSALKYHPEALAIRRELGNPEDIGDSLIHMGLTTWTKGDLDEGWRLIEQSRSIVTEAGLMNSPVLTLVLTNKGLISNERGEFEKARAYCEESIALLRAHSDRWGEAITVNVLGDAWFGLGNTAEAESLYRYGLQISYEINSLLWLSHSVCGLAMLLSQMPSQDSLVRAIELFAWVQAYPASWHYIRQRAVKYLETLEVQLPADIYAMSMKRGVNLQLEGLVKELLDTKG